MANILVVATDVLPIGNGVTTGAGLRAWGLGQGLAGRGHHVEFAMPTIAAEGTGSGTDRTVHVFELAALDDLVDQIDPEIIVFQHWPLVGALNKPLRARVVIDFAGPLLLETLFREPSDVERHIGSKMQALQKADYFTCAGIKQMYYYLSWLLIAGVDVRQIPISVVPFSLSPDLPKHTFPKDPLFVYGGFFLPWQDPMLGFEVLIEALDRQYSGKLKIFGGEHPWVKLPDHPLSALRTKMEGAHHVEFLPPAPLDQLNQIYCRASVAWDLMARNPEREIAFTSRTVGYLWCGLPVVYNNYSELSSYIDEYDAGWTVDPSDATAIRAVVDEIFERPEVVRQKGTNAQRLVRERLTWDLTIDPLDDYCRRAFRVPRFSEHALLSPVPTVANGLGGPPPRLIRRQLSRARRLALRLLKGLVHARLR